MGTQSNVVGITVTYEDGSVKTVDKGVCMTFADADDGESVRVTMEMVACSGQDLYTIVEATIGFGEKLGMFNQPEDSFGCVGCGEGCNCGEK